MKTVNGEVSHPWFYGWMIVRCGKQLFGGACCISSAAIRDHFGAGARKLYRLHITCYRTSRYFTSYMRQNSTRHTRLPSSMYAPSNIVHALSRKVIHELAHSDGANLVLANEQHVLYTAAGSSHCCCRSSLSLTPYCGQRRLCSTVRPGPQQTPKPAPPGPSMLPSCLI